ncbi:MAG: transposase, partial [Fusobacteria bacterium]|nr:transposase [Fusobacteriota bacterium]
MSKYSDELKSLVVKEYNTGVMSSTKLAKKYGIKSGNEILKWVKRYRGVEFKGITKKNKNEKNSSEFKINIINYMKHNKASYSETSFHFCISESSIIAHWKKEYENHGAEAFNNPQGR